MVRARTAHSRASRVWIEPDPQCTAGPLSCMCRRRCGHGIGLKGLRGSCGSCAHGTLLEALGDGFSQRLQFGNSLDGACTPRFDFLAPLFIANDFLEVGNGCCCSLTPRLDLCAPVCLIFLSMAFVLCPCEVIKALREAMGVMQMCTQSLAFFCWRLHSRDLFRA